MPSLLAMPIADVMELVDMLDLGSSAARRGGSTPFIRTKKAENYLGFFYAYWLQEFANLLIDFIASSQVLLDKSSVCFPLRLQCSGLFGECLKINVKIA